MALSFTTSFAAVVVDFYGNSDYTFTNEIIEDGQDTLGSWNKENVMTNHVSSIIDTHNFSTGLVVNLPECVESLKGVVDFFGSCRDKDSQDDNILVVFGYDPLTEHWEMIDSVKSNVNFRVACKYSKIAFQARTSCTWRCSVAIDAIVIGAPGEVVVSKVSVPATMTNYKWVGDTISFMVPYKTKLEKMMPTFWGLFESVTPSTDQNFAEGPVTFTFAADSGYATKSIVLDIQKLPGDTNANITNVIGFCKNFRTFAESESEMLKNGNYCTKGYDIEKPANSGDTGTVFIDIDKQIPDSVRTNLYVRGERFGNNYGIAVSSLSSTAWYYDGKDVKDSLFWTPIDLENTVFKVTAEVGEPYYYYKFKFRYIESDKVLPWMAVRNHGTSVRLSGNNLLFEGDMANVQSLSIYDALGHEVYAKKSLGSNTLDIGFLNRGVYVVKAETSRGLVTERIVKRE